MKKHFNFAFILIIVFSCQFENPQSDKSKEKEVVIDSILEKEKPSIDQESSESEKITKTDEGIIIINMMELLFQKESLIIYNLDSSSYAEVATNTKVNDTIFNLLETSIKVIHSYLNCRTFDPEYGLFIMDCKSNKGDYYQVILNNELKLIKKDNRLAIYRTFQEYILSTIIILTNKTPLHLYPDIKSEVISNFQTFVYKPIEIQGEWLKLECHSECDGCPKGKIIIGWVQWIVNDKIIVEIAYSC